MCEVSKLLTVQNTKKLSLKNKFRKRLNTKFPDWLWENWPIFSIIINKYFLPRRSNFFVRLNAVSYFISQNLEVIDYLVPEIKNYNYLHMAFSHKYIPEYYGKITSCDIGKYEQYGVGVETSTNISKFENYQCWKLREVQLFVFIKLKK